MRATRASILSLLIVLPLAGPALADQAVVTTKSVNVRAGASTTDTVRGTLAQGTIVEILETSGEWYRVRTVDGRLEGWVNARLLERRAAPAASASPASRSTGLTIDHHAVACLVAEQFP